MTRIALLSFAAAGLLLFAGRAAADACVEIDAERDTLTAQERSAARALFMQALESNGQKVSKPCDAVYRVYNVRLGNSVSAAVTAPQGTRSATVRTIEDLPSVYDQMVRSLLTGVPMSTTSSAVTRENVTSNQAAPRRAEADSLWYARIGYGTVFGGGSAPGPAIGFGYRYELDQLGVDLSFINLAFPEHDSTASGDVGISGSWARLLALYYLNPKANSSIYGGGGLSWGGSAVTSSGNVYSGSGIQGELSVGYEMLRASTIRLFVQADLTLPFYKSTNDSFDMFGNAVSTGSRYTPTFVIALGGGFGRGNLRVNIVP